VYNGYTDIYVGCQIHGQVGMWKVENSTLQRSQLTTNSGSECQSQKQQKHKIYRNCIEIQAWFRHCVIFLKRN